MELKIYNTLSRTIETFTPIDPKNVRIYSCGPTVYRYPHIGNLRKYYVDDLLKNVIRHILGYKTTHVINITDVGHLVSDADDGEDKMEKGAKREGLSARDIARKYEAVFVDNLKGLHIDLPDYLPRATEHITEQIQMIQELERNGFTYTVEGDGIYMDTGKMKDYGALVGQKHLDGLQSGSRIDLGGKKSITDFALRKFNMTGQKREMERESPWGIGFPGRHIECSAMSCKYLGKEFDIHTGGIDHIPIHHTNEIAQSECSGCGKPRVHYRIHTQFLNINNAKIAKADGNLVLLSEVFEKGYTGEDLRYFYLQAHYRSFQDFTREALEAARKSRYNIIRKIASGMTVTELDQLATFVGRETYTKLSEILLNDLDTPNMLALVHASVNGSCSDVVDVLLLDAHVMKLGLADGVRTLLQKQNAIISNEIQEIADQRRQAKQDKNRVLADELRNKLTKHGRIMKDGKDSFELIPN